MLTCAAILDGVVVNTMAFDTEEDIENFNFPSLYGEGSYGVLVPPDTFVNIGFSYKDGVFIAPPAPEPTHDELVGEAEAEKYNRLNSADSVFLEWQTKLLLNIASEDEKNAVIAWVNYKDAVRSVDTSQAPNITWPEQPPIPDSAQ